MTRCEHLRLERNWERSTGRVMISHVTVPRARDEHGPVPAELDRADRLRMCRQNSQHFACTTNPSKTS